MSEAGAILWQARAGDPTSNPASGNIFLYVVGDSVKYKTSAGAVNTLSTGVTAEEVQDIVGAFFSDSSTIDVTYDDGSNTFVAEISASVLSTINSALQPGGNVSDLINDAGYLTSLGSISGHTDVSLTGVDIGDHLIWNGSTFVPAVPSMDAIFGSEFEYFEDMDNISYTTNTPFLAYSFTTQSKPSGLYRIGCVFTIEPGSTSNNDFLTVRINGTALDPNDGYADEGKDTGSDIRRKISNIHYYTHTGPGSFDLELWANQDGSGTSVIHNVVFEIWRVA